MNSNLKKKYFIAISWIDFADEHGLDFIVDKEKTINIRYTWFEEFKHDTPVLIRYYIFIKHPETEKYELLHKHEIHDTVKGKGKYESIEFKVRDIGVKEGRYATKLKIVIFLLNKRTNEYYCGFFECSCWYTKGIVEKTEPKKFIDIKSVKWEIEPSILKAYSITNNKIIIELGEETNGGEFLHLEFYDPKNHNYFTILDHIPYGLRVKSLTYEVNGISFPNLDLSPGDYKVKIKLYAHIAVYSATSVRKEIKYVQEEKPTPPPAIEPPEIPTLPPPEVKPAYAAHVTYQLFQPCEKDRELRLDIVYPLIEKSPLKYTAKAIGYLQNPKTGDYVKIFEYIKSEYTANTYGRDHYSYYIRYKVPRLEVEKGVYLTNIRIDFEIESIDYKYVRKGSCEIPILYLIDYEFTPGEKVGKIKVLEFQPLKTEVKPYDNVPLRINLELEDAIPKDKSLICNLAFWVQSCWGYTRLLPSFSLILESGFRKIDYKYVFKITDLHLFPSFKDEVKLWLYTELIDLPWLIDKRFISTKITYVQPGELKLPKLVEPPLPKKVDIWNNHIRISKLKTLFKLGEYIDGSKRITWCSEFTSSKQFTTYSIKYPGYEKPVVSWCEIEDINYPGLQFYIRYLPISIKEKVIESALRMDIYTISTNGEYVHAFFEFGIYLLPPNMKLEGEGKPSKLELKNVDINPKVLSPKDVFKLSFEISLDKKPNVDLPFSIRIAILHPHEQKYRDIITIEDSMYVHGIDRFKSYLTTYVPKLGIKGRYRTKMLIEVKISDLVERRELDIEYIE